jgi:hypothetical protein
MQTIKINSAKSKEGKPRLAGELKIQGVEAWLLPKYEHGAGLFLRLYLLF